MYCAMGRPLNGPSSPLDGSATLLDGPNMGLQAPCTFSKWASLPLNRSPTKMGDSGQFRLRFRLRLQANGLTPTPVPTPVVKKKVTPVPTPTPVSQKLESTPGLTPTPESESPIFACSTGQFCWQNFTLYIFPMKILTHSVINSGGD